MAPAQIESMPLQIRTHSQPRFLRLARERLEILGRAAIWRSIWRSLLRQTGSRRKALSVRESTALGDRRYVSVIQFERQRFLIGSSPTSVSLLAQLPDASAGTEETGEASRHHSAQGKTIEKPAGASRSDENRSDERRSDERRSERETTGGYN